MFSLDQDSGLVRVELEGMSVTLPHRHAGLRFRPLASSDEIAEVARVLRAGHEASGASWQARRKANGNKVGSGEIVRLAEVVADYVRREQQRGTPTVSWADRRDPARARTLLAAEVAAVKGIDRPSAEQWISAQLEHET